MSKSKEAHFSEPSAPVIMTSNKLSKHESIPVGCIPPVFPSACWETNPAPPPQCMLGSQPPAPPQCMLGSQPSLPPSACLEANPPPPPVNRMTQVCERHCLAPNLDSGGGNDFHICSWRLTKRQDNKQ